MWAKHKEKRNQFQEKLNSITETTSREELYSIDKEIKQYNSKFMKIIVIFFLLACILGLLG